MRIYYAQELKMNLDKIYKRDVAGGTRVWWAEVGENENEGYWRTHSGTLNGEILTTEWKYAEAKRQPNSLQQAIFNAKAEMTKKLKVDYKESLDDIDETRNSVIRPMLANEYVGWVGPCFAQPKLDGMRCLANKNGLWSRLNNRIISTPHIEGALKEFFRYYPDMVLDGELYNHDLSDNFNMIMSLCKKTKPSFEDLEKSAELIQYWVYDMYNMGFIIWKFSDRFKFLQSILFELYPNKSIVQVLTSFIQTEEDLNLDYMTLLEHGFEGQIIRLNVLYEQKRTSNLLKRKDFVDQEFELLAIEEGQGQWSGLAKRAICVLPDGRQFAAGISGTQDFCNELLQTRYKYQAVTVKYHALTPDGIPRFPIAVKFWEKEFDALEERIKAKKRDLFG
jgi:DNA ligase-1